MSEGGKARGEMKKWRRTSEAATAATLTLTASWVMITSFTEKSGVVSRKNNHINEICFVYSVLSPIYDLLVCDWERVRQRENRKGENAIRSTEGLQRSCDIHVMSHLSSWPTVPRDTVDHVVSPPSTPNKRKHGMRTNIVCI